MNTYLVSVLLVIAPVMSYAGPNVLSEVTRTAKIPGQAPREIRIVVHTGWSITVREGGTSTLHFGARALDGATIPREKMSVTDVFNRIAPRLREEKASGNNGEIVYVNMWFEEAPRATVRSLERDVADQLFRDIVKIAIPYDVARFKMLLDRHPIGSRLDSISPIEKGVEPEAPQPANSGNGQVREVSPPAAPDESQSVERKPELLVNPRKPGGFSFWLWLTGGLILLAIAIGLKTRHIR